MDCEEQEFCPVYAAQNSPIRCHKTRLMEPCIYYGKTLCPQLVNIYKIRKARYAIELNDPWHNTCD